MTNRTSKEYQRDYHLRRYHQRRAEAIEFLGGECVECGTTDSLQLDHKDPATKSFDLAKLWGVSEVRFWAEVLKCQLLCAPHHREKTKQEQISKTHGTWGWVRKRKCKCDVCREFVRAYQRGRTKVVVK